MISPRTPIIGAIDTVTSMISQLEDLKVFRPAARDLARYLEAKWGLINATPLSRPDDVGGLAAFFIDIFRNTTPGEDRPASSPLDELARTAGEILGASSRTPEQRGWESTVRQLERRLVDRWVPGTDPYETRVHRLASEGERHLNNRAGELRVAAGDLTGLDDRIRTAITTLITEIPREQDAIFARLAGLGLDGYSDARLLQDLDLRKLRWRRLTSDDVLREQVADLDAQARQGGGRSRGQRGPDDHRPRYAPVYDDSLAF